MELSEEGWNSQVDANLKSVFLTLKHVLPIMEKQKSGVVVNIASASGLRWTGSAQVGYAATKAGVIQLTRVVAVQYAGKGIRVNTVIPGQLHTPMGEHGWPSNARAGTSRHCWRRASNVSRSGSWATAVTRPMPRCFLASDEARFITGTEIVVDGGMTVRCN